MACSIAHSRHNFQHSFLSRITWIIARSIRVWPLFSIAYLVTYYTHIRYGANFKPTWPENQTKDVRRLIRPKAQTTLVFPKNICYDNNQEEMLLVIVVTSAAQNRFLRQGIRDTWAKDLQIVPYDKIKLVFLVGKLPLVSFQSELDREYEEFGDILQENFIDTYPNLTIKSLFMLKWFRKSCSRKTKYLMKADDDVYINIPEVYNLITTNKNTCMLAGFMHCGASPITNPFSKQYAPPYMLKHVGGEMFIYPNFLSGSAYVMTNTTAEILYRMSMITPVFHLEDVYLTGILPTLYNRLRYEVIQNSIVPPKVFPDRKLLSRDKEIIVQNDRRFNMFTVAKDPCLYANLISSHEVVVSDMKEMYIQVRSLRLKKDWNSDVCGNKPLNTMQKFCNFKNTIYGGQGPCCSYTDYIRSNILGR